MTMKFIGVFMKGQANIAKATMGNPTAGLTNLVWSITLVGSGKE
jgi:hypothetical protein